MRLHKRIKTAMLCLVMGVSIVTVPFCLSTNTLQKTEAVTTTTLDNMPTEYRESLDWIWQNRILDEKSTERRNLIFDQIVAGN
ncbi:MAG TPA: dockerin, partial [Clostridiales bacterium]|nr:dockerin [Clostridiales bacterium]